jgi:hypothetical protein
VKLIPVVLMLLVVAGVFYFMARPRRRGHTRRGEGSGGDAGSTACHGSRDTGSCHAANGSGDCGGDGGGGGD